MIKKNVKFLLTIFLLFLSFNFLSAIDNTEEQAAPGINTGPEAENKKTFFNPILPGFYPDPSICRAGDDYYIVNSTFSYFGGLPVFHSKDLVNWRQICNALNRSSQVNMENNPLSSGVFAPSIHYHKGIFYISNTLVGRGGNYIIYAANPAGPWSDPIYIHKARGIDPSLFFDDNGKAYWVSNGDPSKPRYSSHKVIWMQELDLTEFKLVKGTKTVLVDAGSRPEKNPIWIEGPHLYKINDYYYVMAAEGGTGENHSEVIFRSKEITGPYESYNGNPILTQRNLPNDRKYAITSTGHADMVETQNGEWWAIFLACRPYEPVKKGYYNTGRETFMAPVKWKNGWPIINPDFKEVQYSYIAPDLPEHKWEDGMMNGNFTLQEDFNNKSLPLYWMFLRTPINESYSLSEKPGHLLLRLKPAQITERDSPSFICRRQQHLYFTAETSMLFSPETEAETAGIVAFQNEQHFYFMGVALLNGKPVIRLLKGVEKGKAASGLSREIKEKINTKTDATLFKTERFGNMKYEIPVPADQTYTITFRMAESKYDGPGMRIFNILVDGEVKVRELDIYKKAGGAFKAYDLSVTAHTKDDSLDIEFRSIIDKATVSAIYIQDKDGRYVAALNCGGPIYKLKDDTKYVLDAIYLKSVSESDNTLKLAEAELTDKKPNQPLHLRIKGEGKIIGFYYSYDDKKWNVLEENIDNTHLSTRSAGGFVGVVLAMYASSQGTSSKNFADFDWFSYTGDDPVYKE